VSNLIHIDGSYGEGGGQIIRTSCSLAAITGRAVQIYNVRAKRTRPGLQPQHLMAVRAAAALCNAKLTGDEVGSVSFTFEPQSEVQPGEYSFEIGTAGAAPLVVQTVLLPLALTGKPSNVRVSGGTHVPHSPPIEYLETVYVPVLCRAGLDVKIGYSSAGFYPKGGGEIEVQIGAANEVQQLDFRERGKLKNLDAFVVTANLPEHVGERGVQTLEKAMNAIGRKAKMERRVKASPGPGAAVVLTAECENGFAAFSSIGELRKPMEKVAEAPAKEFMKWWKSGAACDEHLADQLVLPMCFVDRESRWTTPEVTEHLRTVLWVVQHFLEVEASLEEQAQGGGVVTLKGIGK
jgi:RNA 3'-terminal phosphate cyclase (ATP)